MAEDEETSTLVQSDPIYPTTEDADQKTAQESSEEMESVAEGSGILANGVTEVNQDSGPKTSEEGASEQAVSSEEVPNEQELKYWNAVNENPQDFTSWTYLLQFVEQENKLSSARKAFASFFKRYPYCYGYWKKFADLEKKNANMEAAKQVFEDGVAAIPLSVDLWVHYLNFASQSTKGQDDGPAVMRSLFEKAVASAGEEFRSDKLWEAYMDWEKSQNKLRNVTALYDRLLKIPTQQYSKHFEKFKEHINTNPPSDILDTEELLKLRAEVGAAPPGVDSDATVVNIAPDVAPPGEEDSSGGEAEPGAPGEEPAAVKANEDAETTAIREKVIAARQAIFTANEDEVRKRWSYEEAIKRPYFHVKPLERVQLKNWREYLDFEIAEGNEQRIKVLFERCMVACALYEDFWQKYATHVEKISTEQCRGVYERACDIHLPRKVNIHLSWAAFEEMNGDPSKASLILENIEKAVPGYTMLRMKRINLERRRGDNDRVKELYTQSIQEPDTAEIVSFFAVKYSRFLSKVLQDMDGARKVLKEALEKDKSNKRLYLQLLDLELHSACHVDEEKVEEVFEAVENSDSLSSDVKQGFSQRRLEFLEDYSTNVDKIMKAYENHQKLSKNRPAITAAGKKRPGEVEADGKNKSLKTDESQGASQTSSAVDSMHQDPNAYSAYSSAYASYYSNPSVHSTWANYSQPNYNYNAWYQQHYGSTYGQTTQ